MLNWRLFVLSISYLKLFNLSLIINFFIWAFPRLLSLGAGGAGFLLLTRNYLGDSFGDFFGESLPIAIRIQNLSSYQKYAGIINYWSVIFNRTPLFNKFILR